jgi:predicted RNase H-like HicB family nuclease
MSRQGLAHMNKYTVVYERDEDGWWVAAVPAIPGCHTQGRTIRQARSRIREALSLYVDDAGTAELCEDIRLPEALRAALDGYWAAKHQAEEEQARALSSAARAAHTLTDMGHLSRQDVSELLGLPYQRVQQLVASDSVA